MMSMMAYVTAHQKYKAGVCVLNHTGAAPDNLPYPGHELPATLHEARIQDDIDCTVRRQGAPSTLPHATAAASPSS